MCLCSVHVYISYVNYAEIINGTLPHKESKNLLVVNILKLGENVGEEMIKASKSCLMCKSVIVRASGRVCVSLLGIKGYILIIQ